MWERLEGPLQVCRRPQVFYRRSHSVRLSRRSHVSQRVASTSEQPSQSWALKSRHCGLLVKACGPSGHSGHLLKLAKAPSGHLLKLAKAPSGHSGHSGANRKRAVSTPSTSDILASRPAIDGAVVVGPAMKTSKASARGRCRSWRSGMPPSPRRHHRRNRFAGDEQAG